MSYNVNGSNWTADTGPTKKAIAAAGNPDIICLQNAGTSWKTISLTGYGSSYQNRNTEKFLIYYKSDKFDVVTSNYTDYLSYLVLKRKGDGTQFAIVNAYFNNSLSTDAATREKQLKAIWDRVDGFWNDKIRGLMPIIITGNLSAAPADSNVYQSLTENGLFFDASVDTKSILSTNSADTGNYVFASYHMQSSIESYNVIGQQNGKYPMVVKVAFSKGCSHILAKTEAVAATCETAGSKEYYTCSTCYKVFADAYATIATTVNECKIPALGHAAGAAATCEAPQTCIRCDYEFQTAIGHAWTNVCDTVCNNGCGTTRDITHNYKWIVDLEPTLESEGIKHEECVVCHATRNENTSVEKLTCVHSFIKTEAIDATCLTEGNEAYYTCSICNKVYSNEEGSLETTVEDCVIPALGHAWQAATCTAPATCSGCGETDGEPIAHTWKAASCTVSATCSVCGTTDGDPLGHTWKAATCLDPKTCSVCDATEGGIGDHNISSTGICTVCAENFNRTITFRGGKLASGTYAGDNAVISTATGIIGNAIVFPTPAAVKDHNLAGWYLDYACTQPFTGKTFSEDMTLYAKWASNVQQQITIMSFNIKTEIWKGSRADLVVATILENAPDVVCVQEADQAWMSILNSKLTGYTGVAANQNGRDGKNSGECTAIFYRADKLTPVASMAKWLSNTPDSVSKYSYTENGKTYTANYNRMLIYAVFKRNSDGALFTVVNTHLDNNGNNTHEVAEKIRQAEVDIMMKIIKGITDARGDIPVIVTGDFNIIPGDNRTAYKAMTKTYGYSDSSKIAKEGEIKNTFNGEGSGESILDYIFVSSNIATAVEDYIVCDSKRNGEWISDHNAIIAVIAIPKV